MCWEHVDLIQLAEVKAKWHACVKTLRMLWFHKIRENSRLAPQLLASLEGLFNDIIFILFFIRVTRSAPLIFIDLLPLTFGGVVYVCFSM